MLMAAADLKLSALAGIEVRTLRDWCVLNASLNV